MCMLAPLRPDKSIRFCGAGVLTGYKSPSVCVLEAELWKDDKYS